MSLVECLHDRRRNPTAFGHRETVLPCPVANCLILITVRPARGRGSSATTGPATVHAAAPHTRASRNVRLQRLTPLPPILLGQGDGLAHAIQTELDSPLRLRTVQTIRQQCNYLPRHTTITPTSHIGTDGQTIAAHTSAPAPDPRYNRRCPPTANRLRKKRRATLMVPAGVKHRSPLQPSPFGIS